MQGVDFPVRFAFFVFFAFGHTSLPLSTTQTPSLSLVYTRENVCSREEVCVCVKYNEVIVLLFVLPLRDRVGMQAVRT